MNGRRLLIVDPDFVPHSPAMKGVLRSLPELRAAGFEIEAWCWEMAPELSVDHLTLLPTFGARCLKPLQAIAFSMLVTLLYIWRYDICRRPRPEVIYSIVPYLPQADVSHAHFSPWDWENRMRAMGCHTLKDWLERAANLIIRAWTDSFLTICSSQTILSPSQAVASDLRLAAPHLQVEVLPNSYDPTRFHAGVRDQWRNSTRASLGYNDAHVVFIFVSTGHYRRKGFFIAVEALERLRRRHDHVRFLVVGGKEATLHGLRSRLTQKHPDWQNWLHFTGSTTFPEKFFAVADGFLYPSWSEAFALVEIEAAACGLPLFLTPHHGSEMVLEDGVNGRLISYEPEKVATVLEEFVCGHWKPAPALLKHALDSTAYAQRLTAVIEQAALK
jgi:glycosyltransferase involved in cell wall biosynthesis